MMTTKVGTPTSPQLSLNNCETYFLPLSHKSATTSTTKEMEITGWITTTTMEEMRKEELIMTTLGMGGTLTYTRWVEKMELVIDISNCAAHQRVKYTASSLTEKALTWWNTQIQARGAVYAVYTDRFHELAKLVPHLVTPVSNRINRYIHGLVPEIRGIVQATEPSMIQSAILRVGALTNDAVRDGKLSKSGDKRKGGGYKGNLPKCDGYHQEYAPCRTCFKCNRTGHFARDRRAVAIRAAPVNAVNPKACYECESSDHLRNMCPRLNRAPGQVQNHPKQVLAIDGNNPKLWKQ
ncbi:reverse transcriptase domain-containing protein [Tanacetum coccineum]